MSGINSVYILAKSFFVVKLTNHIDAKTTYGHVIKYDAFQKKKYIYIILI